MMQVWTGGSGPFHEHPMRPIGIPALLLTVWMPAAPAPAQDAPFTGEIVVVLDDAVFQAVEADGVTRFHGLDDEIPAVLPRPLSLELSCVTGRWDRVWGVALSLNQADHRGRVLKALIEPDRVRFVVQMKMEGDPWVAGGRGEYAIDLRREGNALAGAYAGTYRGRRVRGAASGQILPPRPSIPPGFVPAAPGEHPRILFRRSDLPGLREKAETPFGKTQVEAMRAATDDPVALGMLWQLTGDRDWAHRAAEATGRLIALGDQAGPSDLPHAVGERLAAAALAYDLCYDAWAEEMREQVLGYLVHFAERTILRPQHLSAKMNFSPASHYQAVVRGGGGMAGLAFWGERGPEPVPPVDPGVEPAAIVSPRGFEAGDGVPVVPLVPDRSPDRWLFLGPFPFATAEDVLVSIGGAGRARPSLGTEVECRGEVRAFEPLDASVLETVHGGIDVPAMLRGASTVTVCLYTVLEVETKMLARFVAGHPSASATLSGRPLVDDDYLAIAPGLHPFLIQFSIGGPWGTLRPRFVPVTPERAGRVLAARRDEYRAALEDWRDDRAEWERTGGFHPHLMRLFALGERQMARYAAYAVGDGGWQTEGESLTLLSCPIALAYAHGYRNMFGRLPSPRPDLSHFAPRYVMQTVFPGGGRRPIALSDSLSDGTLAPRHYARAFTVTEPVFQPAVHWAWDRALESTEPWLDGADADGESRAIRDAAGPGAGQDAAFALVAYPLGRTPGHPEGILPRAWAAPTRGGYIFRNAWRGADDIITQVFLKSLPANAWSHPTAGSIRLYGLGHVWGDDGAGNPKAGSRWFENVVLLPDDPINADLGARVTRLATRPDGSGAITFDLKDVYSGAKRVRDAGGREQTARLTDQMFRVLREHLVDLGIAGMRSVAVDYGGASGAPALLAVVDRVSGGGRKLWTWQVPGTDREKPDVAIAGRSFTLRHGDVSLRVTFAAPSGVRLERVTGMRRVRLTDGREVDAPLDAVQASGADGKAGDFFAVMTLQRGAAPEVLIDGDGLAAVVRVGRQVVRFDGDSIVMKGEAGGK